MENSKYDAIIIVDTISGEVVEGVDPEDDENEVLSRFIRKDGNHFKIMRLSL